jgi:hypothetical protein
MVEGSAERLIMLADFGETVSYTPAGGVSSKVKAIFDQVYDAVEVGGSVPFALTQPRLTLRSSDVSGVAEGDSFMIRSFMYKVSIVMADGTGITELALEAQ